jgi:hypothetical protein
MLDQTKFCFGFRVLGGRDQERKLIDWQTAFDAHLLNDERAQNHQECYLSCFLFSGQFCDYLQTQGTTKGFSGPTFSPWLWFDIDREHDIDRALTDSRRLVGFLCDRWHIDAESLLLFFSGSKGFHVGVPTSLWFAQPDERFHAYVKHFALWLAQQAAVEIDTGVYDRVRLFRAPNSRHQRTGLHKRQLSGDEFFRMSSAAITMISKEPEECELPAPVPIDELAADDWGNSVSRVDEQTEAELRNGRTDAKLNALTRAFIQEGAATGDRHRLLYSAACNLAEFGCPDALAYELLMTPGLDSGLSPSDVRRQIDCGLRDGGRRCG